MDQSSPERRVEVVRSSSHQLGGIAVSVGSVSTRITLNDDSAYARVYRESLTIPPGHEDDVIKAMMWVKEERARWSVLEAGDRADV